jgi:hypothetical protein
MANHGIRRNVDFQNGEPWNTSKCQLPEWRTMEYVEMSTSKMANHGIRQNVDFQNGVRRKIF